MQGKKLQLRNVRFQNCVVPVQQAHFLPADSAVNGTIPDNFHINAHSLPK
jgi:hypothetical protein